jgi:hypothetical protein
MMELQIIKRMSEWLVAVCIVLTATSCYYDVEEVLYPGGCNSETVTYSGTVLPILQRECFTCHDNLSQNGGISLEGYSKVLITVDNGSLLGAIRHEQGYSAMPDGLAKLDACTIEKIEKWVGEGAPDN